MGLSQYTAPPSTFNDDQKLGWLRAARQEAKLSLEKCVGYNALDSDLEYISRNSPTLDPTSAEFYNRLHVNSSKSRLSDIVSTLANIRNRWEIKIGNQSEDFSLTKVLQKCSWAWWDKVYADLAVLNALQWSAVNRTGYVWIRWVPDWYGPPLHGSSNGEIVPTALGPKEVTFLWLPKDNDHQRAYATIIAEWKPMTEMWQEFPLYTDKIKPSPPGEGGGMRRAAAKVLRGAASFIEGSPEPSSTVDMGGETPGCWLYHMYIRDQSINMTKESKLIGDWTQARQPMNRWAYKVPFIGQDIPTGIVNPDTGNDLTRKAEIEDCYLYPSRRLIQFTDTCVLYDGPSREIHGKAPVVKFTLDPWPWDFLGGSMLDDIRTTDEVISHRLRMVNKAAEMKRNPPRIIGDNQFVTAEQRATLAELDKPGGQVRVQDIRQGSGVAAALPYQHYEGINGEFDFIKYLDELSDRNCGRAAYEALARARQMPSGDTQEKFLQLTGSRTTAKARAMERAVADMGHMVVANILMHYDARRRFTLYGFDGITKQDFDIDRNSLIPSDIPELGIDSKSDLYHYRSQRARAVVQLLSIGIEPFSLHDISSMTRQLVMTRLYEGGKFPLDSWTYAETMNIPNMGNPPQTDDDTLPQRFIVEEQSRAEMAATVQARVQQMMMAANPMALIEQFVQANPQQALQMVLAAMGNQGGGQASSGGGSNGATGNPEGRPPTYSQSPQMKPTTRPDGSVDPVISYSGP